MGAIIGGLYAIGYTPEGAVSLAFAVDEPDDFPSVGFRLGHDF